MVVTKTEYEKLLADIQDTYNAPQNRIFMIPEDRPIYEIDLNSRKVDSPEQLSVQGDHQADTIYFVLDRYYDRIDLTNTIGIIQYKNARLNEFVYVIPFYDTTTKGKDKIIIPWCIQGPATKYSGKVEFSFRFFALDEKKNIIFNLNTLIASSFVVKGWQHNIDELPIEEKITIDSTWVDVIKQMQNWMTNNNFSVQWKETRDIPNEKPTDEAGQVLEDIVKNNL